MTVSAPTGNRGGRATRLLLIVVAERLFAERGIDAVSVAEILDTARQRNKNAIHYHFGGKDGLVTAIAEHRSAALNARRRELLDSIHDRHVEHDVTELTATLVLPLAELLDDEGHFLGFLARYHLDRSRRRLVDSVDPRVTETYREAYRLLREATGLPTRAFDVRFGIALDTVFTALAGRHAAESSPEGAPTASRALFLEQLVASVAGGFSAHAASR